MKGCGYYFLLTATTEALTEASSVFGESFWDSIEFVYGALENMGTWLLDNPLFLIGLTIFVIGASIALVKRIVH